MKLETFGELIQLYQRIVACYRLELSLEPMLLDRRYARNVSSIYPGIDHSLRCRYDLTVIHIG